MVGQHLRISLQWTQENLADALRSSSPGGLACHRLIVKEGFIGRGCGGSRLRALMPKVARV